MCAVIIPRLAEVAEANSSCRNLTKKQDIALSLVDAYRNISECCILLRKREKGREGEREREREREREGEKERCM